MAQLGNWSCRKTFEVKDPDARIECTRKGLHLVHGDGESKFVRTAPFGDLNSVAKFKFPAGR